MASPFKLADASLRLAIRSQINSDSMSITESSSPLYLAVAMLSACVLASCSTRQVSLTLEGSTAQRLVTYSLDQFIEISVIKGKTVRLGVYFLDDHPLMDYATRLIAARLNLVHGIKMAALEDTSEFEVDVFFNSVGTDSDDFGLSVPTFGLVPTSDSINILALDMYHGITEG
jgi:hypothetical protein